MWGQGSQSGVRVAPVHAAEKLREERRIIRPAVDFVEERNIYDIIDADKDHHEHKLSAQFFIGHIVESPFFKIGIFIATIMSSVIIGLQTFRSLEERYGALLYGLDRFFFIVFIFEILLKWYHDFIGFWMVGWNIFDFLVIVGSLFIQSLSFSNSIRIMHAVRVVRAMKSLQTVSILTSLQAVVQTVAFSIPDTINIAALLLICMFIFAILGNSIFGYDCPRHFGSVEQTMFSLFICVTQDGWIDIIQEFNKCGNVVIGAIYLIMFIFLGAFILANLAVAVVVANLEWVISRDEKVERKISAHKEHTEFEATNKMSAYDTLLKTAVDQQLEELDVKTVTIENYYCLLSAIDENLNEFKRIKHQLTKIQQEIQALQSLDDDEFMECNSGAASAKGNARHLSAFSGGDAMSEMMVMNRRIPVGRSPVASIHRIISQLVETGSDLAERKISMRNSQEPIHSRTSLARAAPKTTMSKIWHA